MEVRAPTPSANHTQVWSRSMCYTKEAVSFLSRAGITDGRIGQGPKILVVLGETQVATIQKEKAGHVAALQVELPAPDLCSLWSGAGLRPAGRRQRGR